MPELVLFQSTLLQEERQTAIETIKFYLEFQSTLLQEERQSAVRCCIVTSIFQSTLLQEERHQALLSIDRIRIFQSTLLQEERRLLHPVLRMPVMISIHAPTRGATHSCRTDRSNNLISIHAPTRGATAKMHNYPYTYL